MTLSIDWSAVGDDIDMTRFAVGQGGFSADPMWADRVSEVRALKPKVVRFFLTEHFARDGGDLDWAALDAALEPLVRTGATPLVSLVLKPETLFPPRQLRAVVPSSWDSWARVVAGVVQHCVDRWGAGWLWEVGNEPDLSSGGGAPYSFRPLEYVEFYRHTSAAIRAVDASARIGGPAAGDWTCELMSVFVATAGREGLDVQFVSWHAYQDDPEYFRDSIRGMKALTRNVGLDEVDLVIDEWNMALAVARRTPSFQPAFIAETTLHFLDEGLDLSCYYHIRDYPIDVDGYLRWYPKAYVKKEERFWDRRPVLLGLFDLQNTPRPAYSMMKLLSRLTGRRVPVTVEGAPSLHAIAARDDELGAAAVLVWNYSDAPLVATASMTGLDRSMLLWRIDLHADSASAEDTERLFAHEPTRVQDAAAVEIELGPWGATYLLLDLGLDVLSTPDHQDEGGV